VTGNGKAPPNISIWASDFKELLTTLQALAERHKQDDEDTRALQNVLEAIAERLETLENRVNQLESSQQKPLKALEKMVEGNHQALESQLKELKKAQSLELGSLRTEVQARLSGYNNNCLETWEAAREDRKPIQGLLEQIKEPSTPWKLGGLILILPTLLTWSLIRLLPPQGNLLEQIKGRVNNIEIKLNRLERRR
jgi:chromosome segregation ATPase